MFTDIIFALFKHRTPAYNDFRDDGFIPLMQRAKREVDGEDQIVNPVTLAKQFHEAKIFFDFALAGVVNGDKGVINLFLKKGIDYIRDTVVKVELSIRCILECCPVSIRTLGA